MINKNLNQQEFSYPRYRVLPYGISADVCVILTSAFCLFLLWALASNPPEDRTVWLVIPIFALGPCFFVHAWRNANGKVILDNSGVTRIYGIGSSRFLSWNEIVYREVEKSFIGPHIKLTHHTGKPTIIIHGEYIENYHIVKAEIQAKVC